MSNKSPIIVALDSLEWESALRVADKAVYCTNQCALADA